MKLTLTLSALALAYLAWLLMTLTANGYNLVMPWEVI